MSFITKLLVVYILASASLVSEAGLPPLPASRNVESNLIFVPNNKEVVEGKTRLFEVKEFVDLREDQESNIRVDVKDMSDLGPGKEKRSYFKVLHEHKFKGNLICFDEDTNRCREEHTSTWQLNGLSRMLNELLTAEEFKLFDKLDGTFVGPDALIRLIYANSHRFKLEVKSYDDMHLSRSFYFSLQVVAKADAGRREDKRYKLMVVMSTNHIDPLPTTNGQKTEPDQVTKYEVGTTKLSEVEALGHITALGIVTAPCDNQSLDYLNLKAHELLDFYQTPPLGEALLVSYTLVQPRSQSRRIGVSESDPFMLPIGVGCGQLRTSEPFYVRARQFSGQFEAFEHSRPYFVAYDQTTNHMRYDSIGKLIYSLNNQLVTYVSFGNTLGPTADSGPSVSEENSGHIAQKVDSKYENSHRCSQTRLLDERAWNLRPAALGLSDILGLGGDGVGLIYLGQQMLNLKTSTAGSNSMDGDNDGDLSVKCRVFERVISHSQIPLLVRMHLRLRPQPTSQFSLVFYFVDELDGLTGHNLFREQVHAYESMWLKRIELLAVNSVQRFTTLYSRLTFSKSSWSLETIASGELRQRNSELLHPVRLFDTHECWSARSQIQLDLVLTRLDDASTQQQNRQEEHTRVHHLMETLEESLMHFLASQLDMARSMVCDLELQVSSDEDLEAEDKAGNLPSSMLLRAKLVPPFNYLHRQYLVGWIESFEAVHHARQAKLLERKYLMSNHECLLALATSPRFAGKNEFYMLNCPHVGCGYLTIAKLDDPKEPLDYIKANSANKDSREPSPTEYFAMCELNLVKRELSSEPVVSRLFRPEIIESNLDQSRVIFESYYLTETSELATRLHQAQVTRVATTSGLNPTLRDEKLLRGVCLTLDLKLLRQEGTQMHELPVKILKLQLDQHHSKVHCHLACLLDEFCRTYSYSSKRRECHLSNATRRHFQDPAITLQYDKAPADCDLLALSNANLYKRKPYLKMDSFMYLLMHRNKKLFVGSLDDCADLCHSNELQLGQEAQAGCLNFAYSRLRNLCIMDERYVDERQVGELAYVSSVEQLEAHLGSKCSSHDVLPSEIYERDYSQYLALERGRGLYLEQPQGVEPQNSGLILLVGLDELECARQCVAIDRTCAAFDLCVDTLTSHYRYLCLLYKVRSPLTLPLSLDIEEFKINSSKLEAQLTPLEADFYIEGRSSEHHIELKSKDNCKHYFLEGDQLYLKRQLNVADRNLLARDDRTLKSSMKEALKLQEPVGSVEQTKKPVSGDAKESVPNSASDFWSACWLALQILVGLSLGFLTFTQARGKFSRSLTDFGFLENAMDSFRSVSSVGLLNWWRTTSNGERCSRARSMSQVEITEMIEIDNNNEED